MPERFNAKPLMFGIMNDGGYEPVGEFTGDVAISADAAGQRLQRESLCEFSGSVILDLKEVSPEPAELFCDTMPVIEHTVAIEQTIESPCRHTRVWQYKSERKGDRANRHGKRHHEAYRRRVMLPHVAVQGTQTDGKSRLTATFTWPSFI